MARIVGLEAGLNLGPVGLDYNPANSFWRLKIHKDNLGRGLTKRGLRESLVINCRRIRPPFLICLTVDSLFSTLPKQTCGEKETSIKEKKFPLVVKFFCGHAYSTDLIGHILSARVNRKEKTHADWTNRLNLKKQIVKKKKTKLSVSSLSIKSS